MKMSMRVGWAAAAVLMAAGIRVDGIYVRMETAQVPVARLAANLEARLKAEPKSDDLHVQLARLYGMNRAARS